MDVKKKKATGKLIRQLTNKIAKNKKPHISRTAA